MANLGKIPTTLAIDTSCDETSVSVVRGTTVLSNVLPSQMEFHKKYGGVVPSLAKLAHQERIDNVVSEAIKKAFPKNSVRTGHCPVPTLLKDKIDFIAVTLGPGLAMALEVGIKKAKELASEYKKPLILVNHMEGHLLSAFAEPRSVTPPNLPSRGGTEISPLEGGWRGVTFPALGFLISGGHTELLLVRDFLNYEKIGETLDDSCGEAYDKCGRMLGLGYPAGPVISEFAKTHRKNMTLEFKRRNQGAYVIATNKNTKVTYEMPVPMLNSGDLNFSYSGLKTAMRYQINKLIGRDLTKEDELNEHIEGLTKEKIYDLCVVFEAAALSQLEKKLEIALTDNLTPTLSRLGEGVIKEVWLGGGVVASARLRQVLRRSTKKSRITLRYPYTKKLTGDNAAMIGIAANIRVQKLGGTSEIKNQLSSNDTSLEEKGIFVKNFDNIDRKPNLSLKSKND